MDLISQIKTLDSAIAENTKRIADIGEDETNLARTLKKAQQNETDCTANYVKNPTHKTQDKLEAARDFTQNSQRRFNLFKNHSGQYQSDNKTLWIKRKAYLSELSQIRINDTREDLEMERLKSLKALYPLSLRLLTLTSHLQGSPVLQLSLNRIFENQADRNFKHDLDKSYDDLMKSFEVLDAD